MIIMIIIFILITIIISLSYHHIVIIIISIIIFITTSSSTESCHNSSVNFSCHLNTLLVVLWTLCLYFMYYNIIYIIWYNSICIYICIISNFINWICYNYSHILYIITYYTNTCCRLPQLLLLLLSALLCYIITSQNIGRIISSFYILYITYVISIIYIHHMIWYIYIISHFINCICCYSYLYY